MRTKVKIMLLFLMIGAAPAMRAQTTDSSDASNSDRSNRKLHSGVPGSTSSYTVDDGEVRPSGKTNVHRTQQGAQATQQGTQASNTTAADTNNQAQPNSNNNLYQQNSQAAAGATTANVDTKTDTSTHFCWGWLGLLGLLGLGGLIRRDSNRA